MSVTRERRLIRSGMVLSLLGFAASLVWAREWSGLAFTSCVWCWMAGAILLTRRSAG